MADFWRALQAISFEIEGGSESNEIEATSSSCCNRARRFAVEGGVVASPGLEPLKCDAIRSLQNFKFDIGTDRYGQTVLDWDTNPHTPDPHYPLMKFIKS